MQLSAENPMLSRDMRGTIDCVDVDGGPPRLIALDVDGTLLKTGTPVSDRVVTAVRAAVATGTHIVVSTGRTMVTTRPVLEELGLVRGHAICSNGAVHIDIERADPVAVHHFDPAPAVTALRELFPEMIFTAERVGHGVWATGASPGEYYPGGEYLVVDDLTLGSEPTPRLNCWWPEGSTAEMRRLIDELAIPDISWVYGEFGPWLTISRHGISKGWALERLRGLLDIPRSATLAIGDGFNDREMFAWAGHSVAMANAPAELHDVVDEVTVDVTADGVAAVLERWF